METEPLVSVVIPAYNAELWIGEAIRSVLKQSYRNLEIVIVDDASTDLTFHVTESFPVTVYRNETNIGECRSSRFGFLKTHGRYVTRLSADDTYMHRDHIRNQVRMMELTEADWCYNSVNMSGSYVKESVPVETCWLPIPMKYYRKGYRRFDNYILKHPRLAFILLTLRNPVNASSLMMRRESYEKVLWSGTHRTDCDSLYLMESLLKLQHGVAIHEPGVFYRLHPGQNTNNPDYMKVRQEHRNEMRQRVLNGKYPLWMKVALRFLGA
jgi:glycosyltransferase involved in cell wall biosynthesis